MSEDRPTSRLTRVCLRCAAYVPRERWEVDPPDRVGGGPCEACGRSDMPNTQEAWMPREEAERIGLASRTSPTCDNNAELNFRCPTCLAYPGLCCLEALADGSFPKEPFGIDLRTTGFSVWHDARVKLAAEARIVRAVEEAKTATPVDLGSFAQYADDEGDETP